MASKPSDYFLGIHDFFALLLPGILFTTWLSPVAKRMQGNFAEIPPLTNELGQWTAFLFAALIVGQILFSIAALFDFVADPLAEGKVKDLESDAQRRFPELPDDKLRHVGWAWLRVNSPESTGEIDRLAAYSKFYRSLAVVFLLFALFGFPGPHTWQWKWEWSVATLAAFAASFLAYVFYRVRHRKAIVLYLQLARPSS